MRGTARGRITGLMAGVAIAAGLLASAQAAAAGTPPATRIVGGHGVTLGQYPWQVALVYADAPDVSDSWFCGGTLVAPDRVLTAAHCVAGASAADIEVVAGPVRLSLATPSSRHPVDGIARAAGFVNGDAPRNDLALLRLSHAVPGAQPVALAGAEGGADDALWAPGATLTATGWGALNAPGEGATYYADLLNAVDVTRITDSACEGAFGASFKAAEMVCAGATVGGDPSKPGAGADACNGDSGGGLIAPAVGTPNPAVAADWRLVGVVSWGESCAKAGYPGVYTRVAAPALRAFATAANPQFAPTAVTAPVVSGSPVVGQTLACAPGTFSGSVTSTTTMWFVDYGDGDIEIIYGVTGSTYTLTNDDRGLGVGCLQKAVGPGGTTYSYSTSIGPVTGGSAIVDPDEDPYAPVRAALAAAAATQAQADAALAAANAALATAQAQKAQLDEQARRQAQTEAKLVALQAKADKQLKAAKKALSDLKKAQAKAKAKAKHKKGKKRR